MFKKVPLFLYVMHVYPNRKQRWVGVFNKDLLEINIHRKSNFPFSSTSSITTSNIYQQQSSYSGSDTFTQTGAQTRIRSGHVSRVCKIWSERIAGFNPKARAMVPFRSSSVPIPLAVQGHPLAQTDRTQKEDEVTAQNNLLFFTN